MQPSLPTPRKNETENTLYKLKMQIRKTARKHQLLCQSNVILSIYTIPPYHVILLVRKLKQQKEIRRSLHNPGPTSFIKHDIKQRSQIQADASSVRNKMSKLHFSYDQRVKKEMEEEWKQIDLVNESSKLSFPTPLMSFFITIVPQIYYNHDSYCPTLSL